MADHVIVVRSGKIVSSGSVHELRHLARQPFRVTFVDDPPVDELRVAAGVVDLEPHGREVAGFIDGSPDAFIAALARHRVEHLLMPEPDLEDAFLRLYDEASLDEEPGPTG
jgi:ABC-2 type transport system ATP-binding protein